MKTICPVWSTLSDDCTVIICVDQAVTVLVYETKVTRLGVRLDQIAFRSTYELTSSQFWKIPAVSYP